MADNSKIRSQQVRNGLVHWSASRVLVVTFKALIIRLKMLGFSINMLKLISRKPVIYIRTDKVSFIKQPLIGLSTYHTFPFQNGNSPGVLDR